jgi:hypothetical protein
LVYEVQAESREIFTSVAKTKNKKSKKQKFQKEQKNKKSSSKMGNQPCSIDSKEIDAIKDETGFTVKQIKRIYGRFEKLDIDKNGFLSRQDFGHIDGLDYNPLS